MSNIPTGKKIYLCTPDLKPITVLNGIDTESVNYSEHLRDYSSLTFDVYENIVIDGKQIPSNGYDELDVYMNLYLEDIAYFQMQYPQVQNDGIKEYKSITAYSIDKEWEDKDWVNFKVNTGEKDSLEQLVDDNTDDLGFTINFIEFFNPDREDLSLLHIIIKEKMPTWSVDREDIDRVLWNKKLSISEDSINLYALLTSVIAPNAECIFEFDCLHRKLKAHHKDNLDFDTNIFVGFRNLASQIEQSVDEDSVFTRFNVEGGNNLTIQDWNYNNSRIFNLDYFMHEPYMSQEQIDKFKAWIKWQNDNREQFANLSQQVSDYEAKIYTLKYMLPDDGTDITQWDDMDRKGLEESLKYYNSLLDAFEVSVDESPTYTGSDGKTYHKNEEGKIVDEEGVIVQSGVKLTYNPWKTDDQGEQVIDYDRYLQLLYQMENGKSGYYTYYEIVTYIIPNIEVALHNLDVPTEDDKEEFNKDFETDWELYGSVELEGKLEDYQNRLDTLKEYSDAPQYKFKIVEENDFDVTDYDRESFEITELLITTSVKTYNLEDIKALENFSSIGFEFGGENDDYDFNIVIVKNNSDNQLFEEGNTADSFTCNIRYKRNGSEEYSTYHYGYEDTTYTPEPYFGADIQWENAYKEYQKIVGYVGDDETEGSLKWWIKSRETEIESIGADEKPVNLQRMQMVAKVSMYETEILESDENEYGYDVVELDEPNSEWGFTKKDLLLLHTLMHDTDYTNENILTTSLNTTSTVTSTETIIQKEKELLDDSLDKLSEISQPQITFSVSMDNIMNIPEFEGLRDDCRLLRFIRLGIRDDYSVKLRIVGRSWNPCEVGDDFSLEFSNMVTSRSGRSDLTDLLNNGGGNASKNSITIGSGNSDSDKEYAANLLSLMVSSGLFASAVNGVGGSGSGGIDADAFNELIEDYLYNNVINEASFNRIFSKYIDVELLVADAIKTVSISTDQITDSEGHVFADLVNSAINVDTITTNIITGKDGNNNYYIDMITGALNMDTITTNLIQGHDEYENYYIDMISGAINMDTIYSNLVTGTDGNNHYYIDLLTGELNMGTLYSNFIAATDGNGNYYVDLLTGELNMDTITTNLITGTDGNNQYYIDLVTGALNMDTLYSNFITATDSNNNYYIDLLTGQLNMDTIYTNLITGTDGNNQHYIDLLTGELNMDTIYTNLITGTNGNNQYYIDLLTGTIVGKQVFADEVTTLSINALDQSTARSKIINLVAQNISVSDLQAGDIVLSNQMRILTESTATEGMVMSGSEIQFLDANGNPSISIGYNTVSDGQGGTTVDYDHPAIVIKDENGSVLLNSEGLSQNDVGIAPMIQSHSVTEGKLSFDFIKTPNGDIIVQNFDGSTSTWGREITEFVNSVDDKLETPHPTDVDVVYAVSSSNIIAPLSGWDTTAPLYTLGAYVWEKVITTYENSSTSDTSPVCIQPSGEQYDSILEQYYKSTSNSTQANGSWTTTKPTWESGYYIWTRSIINWTSGDPTYSTPVLATPDQSIYASTINTIRDIATQDEQGRWSLTQGVMQNTYVYTDEEQTNPVSLAALGSSITTTTEGIVASVERNVVDLINTESDKRKALYGTCLTEADTAIKEVMCDNFELYTGATISVEFKYQNTQEKPKLNVEGTGEYLIKSYKNEELSEEEYSWDAGSVLDFVFDGRRWRMLDNGAIKKISTAESRIDMNADKIRAMVTVDGQTSSITLTQNMLEAITDQFVVKSPNGSETIISGGLLSTNAIKSNNYVAPPDGPNPYSITGTFLNLANGNIHSPNFAVDNVNKHAYLNGTIHTKAGEIGGFTITENSIYNNMTSLDDEVADEDIPLGEGIYLEAQDYYVLDEDDYLTTNFRPVLYGVYIGTDGIALGKGKFKVDAFGNMYANSATIVGDITATSLHIENGAMVDGVVTPNELAKVKAVYGTCDTLAADQEKVVVLNDFDYYKGAIITVGFTNGNTHLSPTLNVNQKGARTVKSYLNTTLTEADAKWPAGASVMFVYDGANWLMQDAGVLRVNDLVSNVQDIITVRDTRNDIVRPPQWYITNYPRKRIMEFKTTASLGLTGDTYCWLQTDIPWTDSTGGWPKQVVEVNGKQYWRQGIDADTWSDWIDSYATALESAKTANNYLVSDNTGVMVYDGTGGTKTTANVSTGNVLITSNGMKVRNGQLVLAEYGDSIKIYKPGTQTAVVDIGQNGATFTGGIIASSLQILPQAEISGLDFATPDDLEDIAEIARGAASSEDLENEANKRKAKYGTSNTSATSQTKEVTCSNFELVAGSELTVKFSVANTYSSGSVRLKVGSTDTKDVWVANEVTSSTNKLLWGANAYITFRYDGSQFIVIGEPRMWYGESNVVANANAKSDNVRGAKGCVICKGTIVNLAMTYENTATAPTLNIQSTGDLPLYAGTGTTRPLANNGLSWSSGTSQDFIFDGVQWRTSDSGSAARAKFQADESAKTAVNFIAEGTDGIMVYNGVSGTRTTTNVATGNALITSKGMQVRYGTTVLADYGDSIKIYKPGTSDAAVNISPSGAIFTGGIVASSLEILPNADVSGLDLPSSEELETIKELANGATPKSSAIKSTVSVYYRSTTQSTPSINSSTTIGTSTTTDNSWSYVMPVPKRNSYFYTCEKYIYADNSISFSEVRELSSETYSSKWVSSNDSTYIDGGRIYINSIKSDQIDTSTLTVSSLSDGSDYSKTSDALTLTQRIYYRSNSSTKPTAYPTAWVIETGNKWNNDATAVSTVSGWTTKRTPIANGTGSSVNKYLYLWCATQRKTVDGTVQSLNANDIALDDTSTVIDGGNIITGTVTANQLNVDDINAKHRLQIGAFTSDDANSILNSNMKYSSKNLIIGSNVVKNKWINSNGEQNSTKCMSTEFIPVEPSTKYTLQFWQPANSQTGNNRLWTGKFMWYNSSKTYLSGYSSVYSEAEHITFTETSPSTAAYVRITYQFPADATVTPNTWYVSSPYKWKLERGEVATEWTAAPEDNCVTEIDSNGIWVTPTNKRPTDNGGIVSGVTTGTKIDGAGVSIYTNGSLKATYGDAINLYDPNGNTVVNINQNGATFTGNIVASHLTIEDPSEIEALIDPDNINVKTGIYVSCSTLGANQDKELTISNFSYYQGVTITVGFTNANTHATPRFKINSENAVAIKGYTGANLAEAEYKWAAGAAITFVYDGANWRMQDSGAQQAKASAASSASQASGSASQASSYASNASSSASSASSSASNASSSASSASSSASSASSSASSASSSATSANNAKEAAESARDIALDTVTVKDTQNDNQNPQWYITNYPKRRVMEFKTTTVIGLTGDTYCWLQTDVPGDSSNRGWPKQLAEVNGKQYWRQGTSGTAWSAWIDASAVATNYITDITSDDGIWVTPSDKKPNSNGEAVTTGANATTGTKMDGVGVSIYSAGKKLALYGSTTQFFNPSTNAVATEIGSSGLVINEGIISIGQKTSADDVTHNGTYIDVNGNMATSNINAHGGKIGNWTISNGILTASGTWEDYQDWDWSYTMDIQPGSFDMSYYVLRDEEGNSVPRNYYAGHTSIENDYISLFSQSSGSSSDETILRPGEISTTYVTTYQIGSTLNHDLLLTANDGTYGCRLTVYGNLRPDDTSATQYLGTVDNRWKQLYCTTAPNVGSDIKTKDHIEEIDFSESFIKNLKPVTFMLKNSDHRRKHMGFIAQDISQLCKDIGENLSVVSASYKDEPEGGKEYLGEDVDDSLLSWGITYDEFIAPMVLEIQRLMDKVDKLEYELNELKGVKINEKRIL